MKSIQTLITQFINPLSRRTALFFFVLAALAIAACAEATPTATIAPTPSPAPIPIPAEAVPLSVQKGVTLPVPSPESLIALSRILSLVPGDYNLAIIVDPQALEESPLLRGAFDLDDLGLRGFIPEDATRVLDLVGLAVGDNGEGPLTVMNGDIDVGSLLELAGGLGISLGLPEPEEYRDHLVWDIDVFGLTLAVGQAGPSFVVFSSGSPSGETPAVDIVKSALDSFDDLSPGILSNSGSLKVLNKLPSGFASTLLSKCGEFEDLVSLVDLPGCASAGASAELLDDGGAIFYIVAAFDDETQAVAALAQIIERLQDEAGLPFQEVGVGQEGEMIWARIPVNKDKVAEALKFLDLPDL